MVDKKRLVCLLSLIVFLSLYSVRYLWNNNEVPKIYKGVNGDDNKFKKPDVKKQNKLHKEQFQVSSNLDTTNNEFDESTQSSQEKRHKIHSEESREEENENAIDYNLNEDAEVKEEELDNFHNSFSDNIKSKINAESLGVGIDNVTTTSFSEHDEVTEQELEKFHDTVSDEVKDISLLGEEFDTDSIKKGNGLNDYNFKNENMKSNRNDKRHKNVESSILSDTPDGIERKFNAGRHLVVVSGDSRNPKDHLEKRFPTAIIAGTKKSGTRALLSFLGHHPLVRSAGKEMHFFDKNASYARGLSYYLDQMPLSRSNEIVIEKTPSYFVRPAVPERIYNFSKNIKLLFIFREPVRRAISDYAQSLERKKNRLPFEKIIMEKGHPGVINPDDNKIMVGLYMQHLRRWLHYFPLKQMHFVNGDDFIKNPVSELKLVQKFLNIPILVNEQSFIFNKTKGFYCLRRESTRNKNIECLSRTKGRKHPVVNKKVMQQLTEYYRPHNRELFNVIGRDFGWPS